MESAHLKNTIPHQRLLLLISLMVISTILFVIGITLERGGEARESSEPHNLIPTATTSSVETNTPQHVVATMVGGEAGEGNEAGGEQNEAATIVPTTHIESGETGSEQNEAATVVPTTHIESGETGSERTESNGEETQTETIMGINIENPAFVIAAVVIWLALIVLVVVFGRVVLLPIILAALGTALFDLAEIVFQIGRSNSQLMMLAALVAVAHMAVAFVAAMILFQWAATPVASVKV